MKHLIGIDENGLGPVLGPLTATGVAARCSDPRSWMEGISDSKIFFSAGRKNDFAKLEELSLALFFTVYNRLPASPAHFIRTIAPAAACPEKNQFCWNGLPETFTWSSTGRIEEKIIFLADWMKEHGFFITGLACYITCPKRFNELAATETKSAIDFMGFAEVIRALEEPGAEIEAGKIGGMNNYRAFLQSRSGFPERTVETVRETRERSTYRLADADGRAWSLSFRLNVEEVSFAACIASIVGKYVRELFMHAINAHFETTERISGYRDPKTKAFITRALPSLPARNIPENCFLRRK